MNDNKARQSCQTVELFSVYAIWCRVTNQHYVGVTSQKVYRRICQHKRGKQFVDTEIQRLGWEENFDWWVVERGVSSDIITEREQFWVAFFDCVYPKGYNKTIGGIAHFKHSEETCETIKQSHLGKKRAPFTEEHKAHISESRIGEKNPNYGKPAWNRGVPCPEETKEKIRKKLTGKKRPDQSERMKGEHNPNFGKPLPEKTKAILREKALARDLSGENNPMYGKHQTDEAKEAIRQARLGKPAWNKGVPCSEEQKATLREKALERDLSGENNPFFGKHHTDEAKERNRQAHLGKPSWNKDLPCSETTKAILRAKALARNAAKRAAKAAEEAEITKADAEAAKGTAAAQAVADAAIAKAAQAVAEAQAKAATAKTVK